MTPRLVRLVAWGLVVVMLAACGHSRVVRREGSRPEPARSAQPVPRGGQYEVRRGDTLYGIAFRHGLDYREVAAWNRIGPPYTIYPGQRLRLRPPGDGAGPRAGTGVTGMPAARPATPVVAAPRPAAAPAPATGRPATGATPAPASGATRPSPPPAAANAANPPVPAAVSPGGWRWPTRGQLIGRFVAGDPKRQGLDIAGTAGQPVVAAADGVVVYSGAGLVGYGELIIVKHSDEWLSAYAHNRRRLVGEGAQVKAGQQIAELGRTGTSRDMLHFEVRRNGKPVDPLQVLPPP